MTTIGDILGARPRSTLQSAIQAAAPRPSSTTLNTPNAPRTTKLSFVDYVNRVKPDFMWYDHTIVLARRLQECADGLRDRLIIQMPPRSGKTEEVTQLFGSYWLDQFPDEWVGIVNYGAEKAAEMSAAAQDYFTRAGNAIDTRPHRRWTTTQGGGMWATGIRGPATGRGFNLGIIDDPIKNDEEAASEIIASRNQKWYQSVFYSREAPHHSCIIIMQTRWPGPGDFIGWILDQEMGALAEDDMRPLDELDHPEHWHIISFEALKEADNGPEIPPSCTLEPDTRKPGEALCPARYNRRQLLRIKRTSTNYYWWALYQQRPQPLGGDAYKRDWFLSNSRPALLRPPPGLLLVRYWDHAATEGSGDWTVGLLMGYEKYSGMFYIIDVTRFRKSSGARDLRIQEVAALDRAEYGSVIHWGQQEPGSSGKDASIAFRRLLNQYPVYTEPATGAKPVRGQPVAAAAENGFIRLIQGPWIKAFLDEIETLWSGKYDDQGDCMAGAYNKLVRKGGTRGKNKAPRSPTTSLRSPR